MRELNPMDLDNCVRRLPKQLRALLREQDGKLFVAGGFIRAVIAGEKVSDIDVMASSADLADKCCEQLAEKYSIGKAPFGYQFVGPKLNTTIHQTDNAYTLRVRPVPIQFIHRWVFDTPQAGIESFDFTIAKAALWCKNNTWHSVCADTDYDDLAAKRLIYTSPARIEEAGGSLLRVLKFYQRGYRIPLSSLSAVIARLVHSLEFEEPVKDLPESVVAHILGGLLRAVDPRTPIDEDEATPEEDTVSEPEAEGKFTEDPAELDEGAEDGLF